MQDDLQQIKAISGVRGVILLNRTETKVLSSGFDDAEMKELGKRLKAMADKNEIQMMLTAELSESVVKLLMDDQFALISIAEKTVDISTLDGGLEKLICHLSDRDENPGLSELPSNSKIETTEDYYLKTLNKLSAVIREYLSGYIASREFKKARDSLIREYQFLAGLYIDKSGNCGIVQSPLTMEIEKLNRAFDELLRSYHKSCFNLSGEENKLPPLSEIIPEVLL